MPKIFTFGYSRYMKLIPHYDVIYDVAGAIVCLEEIKLTIFYIIAIFIISIFGCYAQDISNKNFYNCLFTRGNGQGIVLILDGYSEQKSFFAGGKNHLKGGGG